MATIRACLRRDCRNLTASRVRFCFLHTGDIPAPNAEGHNHEIALPVQRSSIEETKESDVEHSHSEEHSQDDVPECCACGDPTKDQLDCKHSICTECLSNLHKYTCPICRAPLAGELVTPHIAEAILHREDRTKMSAERLAARTAARMAADPNYNPNEHYGL